MAQQEYLHEQRVGAQCAKQGYRRVSNPLHKGASARPAINLQDANTLMKFRQEVVAPEPCQFNTR